jgi:hypothetical protein
VTRLAAGLGAAYFVLAAVLAAGGTHTAAIAGQPALLGELQERLVPLVLCVAVLATASQLGAEVQALLAGGARDAPESVALWRALAGFVTTTVITATGASVAAGLALGAFASQLAAIGGGFDALSDAWQHALAVTLTAALTIVSVSLANGVLALVFGAA